MLAKINDSIKQGMLQGNKTYVDVLRLVKAELLNNAKSDKPKVELEVVKSYVKKLAKAVDAFANRPEKLNELNKEIEIINTFLPTPVSEQTIKDHIAVTVQNLLSVSGKPNPGFVIKAVKTQLPDAEGGVVSKLVFEYLKEPT